jgi:hypothetical protein
MAPLTDQRLHQKTLPIWLSGGVQGVVYMTGNPPFPPQKPKRILMYQDNLARQDFSFVKK